MLIATAMAGAVSLAIAGCSGSPQTTVSPSGVTPAEGNLNPDGSTLKVSAPGNVAVVGGPQVDTVRPTVTFSAATGQYVNVALDYEIEVVNANDAVVYHRVPVNADPHQLQQDLTYSDTFWVRVRARLGGQTGPWSNWVEFRTPAPAGPPPPAPGTGGLPFPVPAECGPFGPNNRLGCVLAVAALSEEWGRCRRGDGVGCHRFTRQVGHALAHFDSAWTLILAQPGGHACHCGGCGGSDGRTMYREDTVVYNGNRVFDLIIGAGGPSPSLGWGPTPGPRAGDLPHLPPVCEP